MRCRGWWFGPGILICSVVGLCLLLFLQAGAVEFEDIHVPVIFANFPLQETVFQGSFDPEDLIINSLAADSADLWTLFFLAGDTVTITVAPGNSADILLSIIDSDGFSLISHQNLSPAGEVETISNLSIAEAGEYKLLVQSVHGEPTDYALMLMNQDSYSFVFRGTLLDNDSLEDSLPVNVDHFWFFNALEGQIVSFTITPGGSGDPYIELFDPEGSRMLTIDDTGNGEAESLENYLLPDGGLYGIRVGEFDFLEMDYQISISLTLGGIVYVPVTFNNFPPVFKGNLEAEYLYISSLAADTADHWTLDLTAGDNVTITVAPGNSADILLSLFDSNGLVHQQNLSPTGEVETIVDLGILKSGEYELLVQSVNGQATDYALMFLDQDSYNFVFRGTLQDGDIRTDFLPADVDHFWFFDALPGQNVSFIITPDSMSDPYIELYDPEGARIMTIDDTGEGEQESLEDFALLDSGLYGIRVAEFDFQPMDYQITISIP